MMVYSRKNLKPDGGAVILRARLASDKPCKEIKVMVVPVVSSLIAVQLPGPFLTFLTSGRTEHISVMTSHIRGLDVEKPLMKTATRADVFRVKSGPKMTRKVPWLLNLQLHLQGQASLNAHDWNRT